MCAGGGGDGGPPGPNNLFELVVSAIFAIRNDPVLAEATETFVANPAEDLVPMVTFFCQPPPVLQEAVREIPLFTQLFAVEPMEPQQLAGFHRRTKSSFIYFADRKLFLAS